MHMECLSGYQGVGIHTEIRRVSEHTSDPNVHLASYISDKICTSKLYPICKWYTSDSRCGKTCEIKCMGYCGNGYSGHSGFVCIHTYTSLSLRSYIYPYTYTYIYLSEFALFVNTRHILWPGVYRAAKTHRATCLYKTCCAKETSNSWLVCGKKPVTTGILYIVASQYDTAHGNMHTYICRYICIHLYMYKYIYTCLCVCVCASSILWQRIYETNHGSTYMRQNLFRTSPPNHTGAWKSPSTTRSMSILSFSSTYRVMHVCSRSVYIYIYIYV